MTEPGRYREIWVRHPNGLALCALINGDLGWLMCVAEDGSSCHSSRNPAYAGDADAVLPCRLGNGQEDLYPAAWFYPLPTVEAALCDFERTGERPAAIRWHADFG